MKQTPHKELFFLKTRSMKDTVFYKYALLAFFLFTLNRCFYFMDPVRKAKKALKKKECEKTWEIFSSLSEKDILFAEKAGEECLSQSPKTAVLFYYYLSKSLSDPARAFLMKEKTADIYFEVLKNYGQALEFYSVLMAERVSDEKKALYTYRMAFCYFELGKFSDSLSLLFSPPSRPALILDEMYWNKKFLIGRNFLMLGKYPSAQKVFQEIQNKNPLYFKEKDLFFYLSFIYESQKEFRQAVMELERFKSTSEFLASKIDRLRIRQKNQPGSMKREKIKPKPHPPHP